MYRQIHQNGMLEWMCTSLHTNLRMDKPENCQLWWENTTISQLNSVSWILLLGRCTVHNCCRTRTERNVWINVWILCCFVTVQDIHACGFLDICQARAARVSVVVRSVAKWRPITSATTFIAISTSTLTLLGRSSTAPGCLGKQSSLLAVLSPLSSLLWFHCLLWALQTAVTPTDCYYDAVSFVNAWMEYEVEGWDRGIMRLCARIISLIIGDLPHNWANPA